LPVVCLFHLCLLPAFFSLKLPDAQNARLCSCS
jgi:hypothetical protein